MASPQFTIERSELVRKLGRNKQTSSRSGELRAVWLDERGEALEDAELEDVVLPPAEWPGMGRSIKAEARDPLIISRESPPEAARSIRFRSGSGTATFAVETPADPWVTDQPTLPFGGGPESYEIPVFSELFTDFDRFRQMVEAFYVALRQVAPFSRVYSEGKLRVVGYYARSTKPDGHFQTVPKVTSGERRLYGNQEIARARLANMLKSMPALILIDSNEPGGAGGSLWNGKPYWPSWASIGSMTADASWQEIAIHELAHGFGLSDEYVDDAMKGKGLPPKYTNVSNAERASELSWNNLARLPGPTSLPTHDAEGAPIGGIHPAGNVAAYQGAYYFEDHWRPSVTCRMRNYDPSGFCPVCSRIILAMYGIR